MRITGVIPDPSDLYGLQLVALPGTLLNDDGARRSLLVDLGDTGNTGSMGAGFDWAPVRELNEHGLVVISRSVVSDPPPTDALTDMRPSGGSADAGFYVFWSWR